MSALTKPVRKVFKGIKKVVKKIAKPVLIGAAIFFTAGLAAGGFAAFGAGSGLSFFGAVGQTMAAGAQAIAGSIGIGSGITGTGMTSAFAGAATKGATLGTGVLAQTLGLSAGPAGLQALAKVPAGAGVLKAGVAPAFPGTAAATSSSLAALGGPAASGYAAGTAGSALGTAAGTGGILGKMAGAFNGMSSVGQYAVVQGISSGIQSYAASEEAKKDRKRFMRSGVFGVARGEKYGQAFGLDEIYEAASSVPGTRAYAQQSRQQQAPITSPYSGGATTTPQPSRPSGPSLIGQTYEEGERQNPAQYAMQPAFTNPYQMQPETNQPLLG